MENSLETPKIFLSRKRLLYIVAIIGIVLFVVYAIANIYVKDYFEAGLEFVLVLLLVIALIAIQFKKGWHLALFLGALAVTIISIHNFITGGFEVTGLFWIYMFPPIIFLTQRYKKGIYWTVFLLLVFLTVLSLQIFNVQLPNYFELPYAIYTMSIFLVSFFAVSILIFVYQYTQEQDRKLTVQQTEKLKKSNQELEDVLKKREETEKVTEEKKEEMEKMNQAMTGRELKMIELKKEIQDLKNKLENNKKL